MVTIQNEKLIIEMEHPCPEEFVKDLKCSIISVMQYRELNELSDLKKYQYNTFTLLELLKNLDTD